MITNSKPERTWDCKHCGTINAHLRHECAGCDSGRNFADEATPQPDKHKRVAERLVNASLGRDMFVNFERILREEYPE